MGGQGRRALPLNLRLLRHLHRVIVALGDGLEQLPDRLLDRLGRDPVLAVVLRLHEAAALGLGDGLPHGAGDGVRVHHHFAVDVARRPPRRLDERGGRAQVALLVGVQDRHEGHLREVEPLPQEVDPDEPIELAEAEVADQRYPLQRVDVGVQVPHAEPVLLIVLREVLGHALGEGGDQRALVALGARAHLGHEVVHLGPRRADGDLRVHQAGGPDDLLGHRPPLPGVPRSGALPARERELVGAGRRGHVEGLRHQRRELLEGQGAVVEGGREPETVLDEGLFPRAVSRVHAPDLRHGHVGLVDDDEGVLREVVHQGRRVLARLAPGQVARVVLDAVAIADLPQHLHVQERALLQPLRLEQPPARPEEVQALPELLADALERALELGGRRHVVAGRVDARLGYDAGGGPAERLEGHQPLDRIAPELDAERLGLGGGREDLDHVAPHPEGASAEIVVVPLVLDGHQPPDQGVAVHGVALPEGDVHAVVRLRLADAVDARHRGHDDHVAPLEERRGRGVAHPVDLVVDERVLLDIGVRLRDVGLRLVVVVVGDEVLGRILREEALELAVELGGQGLVG